MLSLRGVSKRFGATAALSEVGIDLFPGEIHTLVGENGAGKSTLIKVITGLHQPDAGQISIDGSPTQLSSTSEAQRLGIAAIYQEPMIFPDLTVAENIFISHRNRGRTVNWRRMYAEAADILASLDMAIDPRIPASQLTVGGQQAVEIAKAISLDVRVLIMDEPTASLSAHEVERLFEQVERLRQRGVAVLFISHRIDEVFRISDRITVFRDGQHISTRPADEVTQDLLVREMVGRDVEEFFGRQQQANRSEAEQPVVALKVDNLSVDGAFEGVDFEVEAGEILGFAGLVGAGRTDVALALFGITPADRGTITVFGREASIRRPADALDQGIAYLSEDRRQLGLSMPQSIVSNITLPSLARYRAPSGLLRTAEERAVAERFRDQLQIKTTSLSTPVGNLSGGNQRKTMLAKWLNTEPRILILDEPTRGIDVGAKADVHHHIDELAHQGMAVILISSDLPEVMAMSDRIAVMREGRLVAIHDGDSVDSETIMRAAVAA
ncbi:MAG: sugar ABC transporter ATP-binding protein [Acidimicrobiales bacterium]